MKITVLTVLLAVFFWTILSNKKIRGWLKKNTFSRLPQRWKIKINSRLRSVWEDTVAPKKKEKEVKGKITEIPVVDAAGNPIMEVKKKGRKHGFKARARIFLLAIISVAVVQWTVELFAASAIFRIALAGLVAWLVLYRHRHYRLMEWATAAGFLVLIGVGIFYLPDFQGVWSSAFNWFVGIALAVFIVEEIFDKDWYPKSVGFVTIGVAVAMFVAVGYSLVRPHEYYAMRGPRAEISISDKQQEVRDFERLKAKLIPAKNLPEGTYRLESSSDSVEVLERWTILASRNRLPSEYGRFEEVISRFAFIAYFIIAGFAFAPVASWEIIQDVLKRAKEKRVKERGQPTNKFVVEVVAEFVREFFAGHAVGGVFKKK